MSRALELLQLIKEILLLSKEAEEEEKEEEEKEFQGKQPLRYQGVKVPDK